MINKSNRQALANGEKVHWYEIRATLGQGGFGITYLAHDSNLNRAVALKEYFPANLASRADANDVAALSARHAEEFAWGLKRFIEEGQTLARFEHPAIVRVLSVFEANGTAYMVMRFEDGKPLSALLDEDLTEAQLLAITFALIEGLAQVHAAGYIHRDIKPANIYIRTDGSPVLLDFGSARQALGGYTQTLTSMVSPGYAPYEQYMSDASHQGPWTDIYALGATLYRVACGGAPMAAIDRSKPILHGAGDYLTPAREVAAGRFSAPVLAAIDHALAFHEGDRPQDLATWRAELAGQAPQWTRAPLPATIADAGAEQATIVARGDTQTAVIATDGEAPTMQGRSTPVDATAAAAPSQIRLLPRPWRSAVIVLVTLAGLYFARGFFADGDNEAGRRIDNLLVAAKADIAAGRLTTPLGGNAYERYQEVLKLEPENESAHEGIRELGRQLLKRARRAAAEKNWDHTFALLDAAGAVDPSNPHPARIADKLRTMLAQRQH